MRFVARLTALVAPLVLLLACASGDPLGVPCGTELLCGAGQQCVDGACVNVSPDVLGPDGCAASCEDRVCGDDGCGGSCGDCGEGESCSPQGLCVAGCQPDCLNRECGDDGCEGSCGSCAEGERCDGVGRCVGYVCGAGAPQIAGELRTDVTTLTFDRAVVGLSHKRDVDPWEDGCLTSIVLELGREDGCSLRVEASGAWTVGGGLRAQALRFAADSQCPGFPDEREGVFTGMAALELAEIVPGVREVPDANVAESCFATVLRLRLEGPLRGEGVPDLLIEASTLSVTGEFISAGSPTARCPCEPECEGRECGDDGCGGQCGDCGTNGYCDTLGQCVCVRDCGGRECGDDGCGGACGSCDEGERCLEGRCLCEPDCDGRECGDDGCGGSCGACDGATVCEDGQCVGDCSCEGRQCGDDGCGVSCGTCNQGERCAAGQCTCGDISFLGCCDSATAVWCDEGTARLRYADCTGGCGWVNAQTGYYCGGVGDDPAGGSVRDCGFGPCVPDCAGRECGFDGCAGLCGTCGQGEFCREGRCVLCQPDCWQRECGDNGCGGSCGTCPRGESCSAEGECSSEPPLSEYGKACVTDGDCWPGLECLDIFGVGLIGCTRICTPFIGTECPEGLMCLPNLMGGNPPGFCGVYPTAR